MPLKSPDFDQWFAASAGEDLDGVRYALHRATGWLWLPIGRVVAGEFIGGTGPGPGECAFVHTWPRTLRTLDDLEIPDSDDEGWMSVLSEDIGDSPESLAVLTDPNQNEAPVVVGFSTGGGDGYYPTRVGRNAAGDITCFATDFMLAGASPPGSHYRSGIRPWRKSHKVRCGYRPRCRAFDISRMIVWASWSTA